MFLGLAVTFWPNRALSRMTEIRFSLVLVDLYPKCAIWVDAIVQDAEAKRVGKSAGVLGKYVEHFHNALQLSRWCECAAKNRSLWVVAGNDRTP